MGLSTDKPDDYLEATTVRGYEWLQFAAKVLTHIETYTIPQYGDKDLDQISEFTTQDFLTQIKKYCNRHGKNSRPNQDLLDLLKLAHYTQMLFTKLEEEETLAHKSLNSNTPKDRYGLDQFNDLLDKKNEASTDETLSTTKTLNN